MLRFVCTCILSIFLLSSVWASSDRYATRSVLSEGKWVKIKVSETGIYKLTLADLKKMGFSDLNKISVHGYGGWPLDEDFSKTYIDDVPAVAVWKGTDYLLFYAKGRIKWEYDSRYGRFIHTNNPYSMSGYYFVTESDTPTKEMQVTASAAGAALHITTYDDYKVWETDLVSVNNSGRELYGESFENSLSQDFKVSVPGITNEEGKATLSFIAKPTTGPGAVSMSVDGNKVLDAVISKSPVSGDYAYEMAVPVDQTESWIGDKAPDLKVNIRYNTTGHKNVRLNYFCLQMKRTLQPYGAYTFFRSLVSVGNASRFVVQNANADMLVFDVTDGITPERMETELNGKELSFSIPALSGLREFAVVQPGQIKSPEIVGDITCPNLHGLPQRDMIIIAQPAFVEQAERLAQAHRDRDGLTIEVVTPDAIYNEFSSGVPDASAYRRFMKMFYDRQTSEQDAPKYLLLFGDGSYDNRKLTSSWKQMDMSNMLLTYQTGNSLNESSYVVDDYFGFLDDSNRLNIISNKVDIGIGRFPVRTIQEATTVVDKVIAYMDNKEVGAWKNNLCFVADDGSNADTFSIEHMDYADQLAQYVESNHPEYLVNKLYFDAYKKDFSGQTSYPEVSSNLKKMLKDGLFLINYTGHGGTEAWSDEKVLKQTDITQFNYSRLPIWITATCDFTRFDDLNTSAGEDVFLNKKSGGIALFTTTRVAYSRPNFSINDKLIKNLFEKKDGKNFTLGDVLKSTKRTLSGSVFQLGFCLIGDPAMKLTYPEYGMKVTSVNGSPVDGSPVSFKALQKITVEGQVLNPDGSLATGFTGVLNPTIKDSKATITTLNNNKHENPFTFTDYPNTIFIGNDSVRNGSFSFTFTVPKDILYSNQQGKMSLYASDSSTGNEAQGAFLNFTVGGTSDTAETDTVGPVIRGLYLNDSTFVDGGKVNTTPFFVAELWDQSGVNISGSSVGHDMMLVIDGHPSFSYNLNSYYTLHPGQDGSGIVKFLLPALSPGVHRAEFRVWDILNNSTLYTFSFEVVEGLKPFIIDITATPSPAREQVQFSLYHNRPESRMTVGIMVYDMTGRLEWKHQETGTSDLFKAYTVTWNLTNGQGSRLRPGIYIYRAAISTDHSKEATKAKKLIILGR